MAVVVMLLEDVTLGAEVETRGEAVSARTEYWGLLWHDRPTQGEGFGAV